MKSRSIFGPGDLASQEMDTKNRIVGGASSDFDTLGEIEDKIKELENNGYDDTEIKKGIEQIETDISLLKENVEFTPRFIGHYSIPWFIEGQGGISASVVQLQKNVFSISISGGGAGFDVEENMYSVPVNIPIKVLDAPNKTVLPYCSPAKYGASEGKEAYFGMIGYYDDTIVFSTPVGKAIGSVTLSHIIVYGELIEDETT